MAISDHGSDHADVLLSLLDFLAETGADIALSSAARNHFVSNAVFGEAKVLAVESGSTPRMPSAMGAAPPSGPPARAMNRGRDLLPEIDKAPDLDALRDLLAAFDGLPIVRSATQLVFEDGNRLARLMIIGEAPGADEDRIGRPFVGRAGRLLDKMLAAIGLDRTHVYIANLVPWRPPGNRAPSIDEANACLPFLRRQIELVDPALVLCLGASAGRAVLGLNEGILRARGKWRELPVGKATVPAMASLHPAYLLRQPLHKRLAWDDFLEVRRAYERLAP